MSSTMPRLELVESRSTDVERAEAILAAVVFGAHKFLAHSDWAGGLGNWLEQLGAATGAGQVRIFANDPAGPNSSVRSSLRAQWIAPGCISGSPFEALQGVSFREWGCGRWEELLSRGQNVVGNIEDCPASEQPVMRQEGIASLAIAGFCRSALVGVHRLCGVLHAAHLERCGSECAVRRRRHLRGCA